MSVQMTTIQIEQSLANLIIAEAQAKGLSVEDYLKTLISNRNDELQGKRMSLVEIDQILNELSEGTDDTLGLPPILSREDIHSIIDFKRNAAEFVSRLEETGHPLVLTVNGKAKVVVQDAAAYRRILELIDRLEAIEGVRKGLESMRAGRGIPFEQFKEKMEKKYGIPSPLPACS